MRVILVRHGRTDWNEEEVFRGRIDVKLNESGIGDPTLPRFNGFNVEP